MKTQDWITALTSGTYGQTTEKLSDGKGNYCCLGVLCEAAGLPKVLDRDDGQDVYVQYLFETPEDFRKKYFAEAITKAEAHLPSFACETLLEDLDLSKTVDAMHDGPEGTRIDQSLHDRLMTLNDSGWSFLEIATYIETVRDARL